MYTITQRHSASLFQRTSSWRTGRKSSEDPPREVVSDPPVRRTDESIGVWERRRMEYYRRVAENMLSQPSYGGHTLVADGGHSFHTVKVVAHHGTYESRYKRWPNVPPRKGRAIPYARLLQRDHEFVVPSYPGRPSIGTSPVGVAAYIRNDSDAIQSTLDSQIQSAYANMTPGRSLFGWGETIVELAKGNLPKVLPDIAKRIATGRKLDPNLLQRSKGAAKALGSDYLAARFGIEPIIRDIVSTVLHLCAVHEMMYDSTKRVRTTQRVDSILPENRVFVYFPEEGGSAEFQNLPSFSSYSSSDIRLSAKFTKARPSSRAEGFYAEAQDFLRTIGFNEKLTWDLLPWSWLVDWSGSIGAAIESASILAPGSGLYVNNYCWATRKTTYTVSSPAYRRVNQPGQLYEIIENCSASSLNIVVTERTQVSPFGPRFKVPSLSPYQWSILVSLGLSRLK